MSPITINPVPLIVGALAVAIGFGGGWTANGWRLHRELADQKAAQATETARQATQALTTLQADAQAIRKAAGDFLATQDKLAPKFDQLRKDVKNAKALPTDCRPDAVRLHALGAGVEAANAAAAGQ